MKVNIRFKKITAVDFEEARRCEVYDKTFREGQVLKDVALEEMARGFFNVHFENGDLAVGVPKQNFEVLS